MRIDRYGDIFSGYFSQACAKSMGDTVRVGTPIAVHARNCHNYLKDATQELACVCLLEDLLPWLQEQGLEGKSYAEKYVSFSELLEDALSSFKGFIWTEETANSFTRPRTSCGSGPPLAAVWGPRPGALARPRRRFPIVLQRKS